MTIAKQLLATFVAIALSVALCSAAALHGIRVLQRAFDNAREDSMAMAGALGAVA